MQKVVTILLALITTAPAFNQNRKSYQYYNNVPSRFGIQHYIDLNAGNIVNAVESFVDDSISSYTIKTDNLSEYHDHDSLEAGRYYPEDEIIITNEPGFDDYELSFVPKWKQNEFDNNTKFVKGVLIHEFIHLYIYQFIHECLENNISINREYFYFNMFPGRNYYGSEFIEEGICEYVVMRLGEGIFNDYKINCPGINNEDEIRKFIPIQDTYNIKYRYSRTYVKPIFENKSFKDALLIILTAKPPSYEELLCPDLYYNRLMNKQK